MRVLSQDAIFAGWGHVEEVWMSRYDHVVEVPGAEVRSAVLHVKPSTEFMPDYYFVRLREWAWIFYHWSLVETVFSLASAGSSEGDTVAERAVELARSLVRDDVPEDMLLTGLQAYFIRSSRPFP